ncbi:MAG: glycosyltransferase [Patescibacteria group bacterium]
MQSRLKLARISLMRIGVYDPYLDTLGGGEKYMLTAASCLSQKHEVSVFWDQKDILLSGQNKFDIDLSRVNLVPDIFTTDTSIIRKILDTRRFDAILFLSDGSLPFVSSDLYVHFQFPVEWVNAKGLIQSQKIKRIKKIICNSNFTKSYIDKKFNKDSIVLHPPTYLEEKMPKVNFDKKQNIILNVGRYATFPNKVSVKKQEFMIDAFKRMCDLGLRDYQFHLVISYLNVDKEKVKNLYKRIGKYPIKILENASYKDLSREYALSKIYWHAAGVNEDLDKFPEKAEHFGITTVEAEINGLVPVVFDAGGQKEIVKEGESGYLWTSDIEFIEKTFVVTRNASLLRKMSDKAVISGHKFSTNLFSQKILNIFDNEN